MALIPITTPDDPRIAVYRSVRERDLIGRHGRFIAESARVVARLFQSPLHTAESVLLSESQARAKPDLLAQAAAAGVPVYVCAQSVMDAVAGFPVHRGVLAAGLRGADPTLGELCARTPLGRPIVALVGLSDADNVGAIARHAACFGAGALVLDAQCCDPLYRKAIRVSAGTVLSLPMARVGQGPEALLDGLEAAGYVPWALTPQAAIPIRGAPVPDRLALLLGAEGTGLPADVLARCEGRAIPMAAGADSLNVATAAAIALYEIAQGRAA
ncbi:MAG: TrmH family RNA methyltransferase [Maricaulaceae bacterium]